MSENMHIFHSIEGEEERYRYATVLEKRLDRLLSPYSSFIRNQVTTSSLLFICIIAALLLANSPWAYYYQSFVNLSFGIHFHHHFFSANLQRWVNDGLLALFFFVVGLEIKQEMLVGVLRSYRRAMVIICAAIGGMFWPALIYYFITKHGDAAHAWGIPMTTDTAFALGLLMLLKQRVPQGLFTFLTALAIIDDMGAVLVIALYYTQHVDTYYLLSACFVLTILILLNLMGVRRPIPYLLLGIVLWSTILLSGIHATIAGILTALTIPARPQTGPRGFIRQVRRLLRRFEIKQVKTQRSIFADATQHEIVHELEKLAKQATTPLQRWKAVFDRPVVMLVLPLFAFLNAGIPLHFGQFFTQIKHPIIMGITLGLVLGKTLGIFSTTWFMVKYVGGFLPPNVTLGYIAPASLICGIGFTMSMFIANLSFGPYSEQLLLAKTGILLASCIAGMGGYLWLLFTSKHIAPDKKSL